MDRKKILWVTPDCFADCDIPYIPILSKVFNIHWIVLLASNGSRYSENVFRQIERNHTSISVDVIVSDKRERDPRKIFEYLKINKAIRCIKPDCVYLNVAPTSPWQIPFFFLLPKNKTIITAHQGRVHEGMGHYKYYNFLRDIVFGRLRNVNMFSKSQAKLFKERYPNSKIFQFVLALKPFGKATNIRPDDGIVRFLSFGTINYTKSIETLIDAACLLYERGVKNFKVSINGSCKDWSWYQERIKYPAIFDLDIRMIENDEIPNLFNGSHYLVQPYRVVSQSGPTKIAFYYNVPNITSDLSGFTDEMIEGVTGFSFETGNPEALADVMQRVIKEHNTQYPDMLNGLSKYVAENYSEDAIIARYTDMFNTVIKDNEK